MVKPQYRVTNHLTQFSGVTAASLANVTRTLGDVHRDIRALLPMDAILVGHSICSDLQALRVSHSDKVVALVCTAFGSGFVGILVSKVESLEEG
jgi:hypothetical protein